MGAGSWRVRGADDSCSVRDDGNEPNGAGHPLADTPRRLYAVKGPVPPAPEPAGPPPVRLRREFKGLTVADIQQEEVARVLPGQVRSALEWIERGDFVAAERALPGQLATVIEGPGHGRRTGGVGAGVITLLASLIAGAVVYGALA